MEKKTPFYDRHVAAGGKIVDYAGFLLPVQYGGVIAEHMAVRQKAGLFDVSHMGELMLTGPDALKNLNNLLTNDFTNMTDGRVRYSPICNENGGIVDDTIVYRFGPQRYMIVPNAANKDKVVDFMKSHLEGDANLDDITDTIAQIAVQGPSSRDIMKKLTDEKSIPAKYYTFVPEAVVGGITCILSQTGYTGEHGYEMYVNVKDALKLWDAVVEAGKEHGLTACGLAARDTLRLEAGMPLYGHEMNDEISPLETALEFAVKMSKPDFIGKNAIISRGAPKITRVGLKVTGRGIVREHCPIYIGDKKIGESTSGTHLPYLNGAYAMALVDVDSAALGTAVEADVRGRRVAAEIVPFQFYVRSN